MIYAVFQYSFSILFFAHGAGDLLYGSKGMAQSDSSAVQSGILWLGRGPLPLFDAGNDFFWLLFCLFDSDSP